jgi:cation:H+ antiporter
MIHAPMESLASLPIWGLLAMIACLVVVLGKGADLLVEEAIALASRWNIPTILVGATIVSLGTTLPEAAVSVMAAVRGAPDIALGNAVGSIICDTGLILGAATLLSPLPLNQRIVNRQGWLQFGAGCLLILSCIPFFSLHDTFTRGGLLPRFMGLFFLLLLVCYLWVSIRWTRGDSDQRTEDDKESSNAEVTGRRGAIKLVGGILMVVFASHLLIPVVRVTALQLTIPQGIVSATIVAFGTSLPELVTAITAVYKGHGELAVGNVIGADILNVLFVAGASASVTHPGLAAPPHFFSILFPAMFFILVTFRLAIVFSGPNLKRSFGLVLLGCYLLTTYYSYSHILL